MAITEVYVDPSIAADSGAGSLADPYGDLEYAIKQTPFDTTNGTRVNIKAGTDEVLAAKIDTAMADTATTAAWVPSNSAPLIFQGYSASAGDGGVGGISGGGLVSIINTGVHDYVFFVDLHLHNTGSNLLAQVDNFCGFIGCEISNTTERGIYVGINGLIDSCYVHNVTGVSSIVGATGAHVRNCYVDATAGGNGVGAISIEASNGNGAFNNIVLVSGAGRGILLGDGSAVENNSIYSDGGTGIGIQVASGREAASISNNLVEGFSGVGGVGIYIDAANNAAMMLRGNGFYNNTTNISNSSATWPPVIEEDNETLTASPFTSPGTGDFSPVDTGNVKEGSLPQVIGGGLV